MKKKKKHQKQKHSTTKYTHLLAHKLSHPADSLSVLQTLLAVFKVAYQAKIKKTECKLLSHVHISTI